MPSGGAMPSGALSLDRDGTDVPHDVDGTHGSDSPEDIWWEKETKRMRELARSVRLLDELEGLDENERSLASARLAEEQRKVAARLCLCVAMDSKSKEAMQAQIKIALAAGLTDDAGLEEAMMALQRKERKAMSAAAPSEPSHRVATPASGAVAQERKKPKVTLRLALSPLSKARGAPAAPPPVPPPVPPPPPSPVLALKVKATPKQLVSIGAKPKPLERKGAPERGRPVGPTPKPLLAIGAAPPPVLPPPTVVVLPPPPPPPARVPHPPLHPPPSELLRKRSVSPAGDSDHELNHESDDDDGALGDWSLLFKDRKKAKQAALVLRGEIESAWWT